MSGPGSPPSRWQAPLVKAIGANLSIDGSGNLNASGGGGGGGIATLTGNFPGPPPAVNTTICVLIAAQAFTLANGGPSMLACFNPGSQIVAFQLEDNLTSAPIGSFTVPIGDFSAPLVLLSSPYDVTAGQSLAVVMVTNNAGSDMTDIGVTLAGNAS